MLDEEISLNRIELYLLDLPQKSVFRSGIGTRKSKETLLVKWIDREGRIGYGECSCRPDPYYSAEFLAASVQLIEQFIIPHLKSTQKYRDILALLHRIRGWNFTKTAIEAAVFQILKQSHSIQLADYLHAKAIPEVPVGISLGIYESSEQLREVVQQAIADGYRRVKFKISPKMDVKILATVNPLLQASGVEVSFDANGSFRENDLERLAYFVDTYDAIIEQPTPPSRFDILLKAKALYPKLKVCFDEEVKSIGDLIKLHTLKLVDELNLKIGRVGGITNSIQILNYCHEQAIPCWIGGMFETGVGRLQNLAFAQFLPQATAHDLSPSSRYFREDIIAPNVEMEQGLIKVARAQQSEVLPENIDKYTTQKISIKL